MNELDQPINAQEKYLHGINMRLNILIDQVSSLVQHIAKTSDAPVEQVVEQAKTTRTTRKRG